MSVIGRLDEGVEAVLINPRRERRTPAEEKREGSMIPAPATQERDAQQQQQQQQQSPGEQREADASLPVWML